MSTPPQSNSARTWLRDCWSVGSGVQLHGRPSIHPEGGGRILIGDRCTIASRPVATHLVAGAGAVLDIGADASIGHGGAIAAYDRVDIGAGTTIGPFVIVLDTNFHGNTGDQSVQHDCRPVVVGAHCRIGARVTITRGATIGDGARILAGSVVSSAIPAGVCAGGARARVLGPVADVDLGWDSAAAVLPLLLMDCLEFAAPVDLSATPLDLPGWGDAAAACLIRRIAARFGINLAISELPAADPFVTLASRIDDARRRSASRLLHAQ